MSKNLEKRVVAFIDILGFRNIVKCMDTDQNLFEIVLDALDNRIMELEYQNYCNPIHRAFHLEMTAFSDCIIISSQVSDDLISLLYTIQSLQNKLMRNGLFIRGGICEGLAYHKERIVFGPAVVHAYEIEKSSAVYPRIIVEDKLVNKLEKLRNELYEKASLKLKMLKSKMKILRRDALDGCWYLDPFVCSGSPENKKHFFQNVRCFIENELKKQLNSGDLGKVAKYRWLALRFNDALTQSSYDDIIKIEIDYCPVRNQSCN